MHFSKLKLCCPTLQPKQVNNLCKPKGEFQAKTPTLKGMQCAYSFHHCSLDWLCIKLIQRVSRVSIAKWRVHCLVLLLAEITSTTLLTDDTKYDVFPDWCCCFPEYTVERCCSRFLKQNEYFRYDCWIGLVLRLADCFFKVLIVLRNCVNVLYLS